MPANVYASAKLLLADGKLGWTDESRVFRAMLMSSSYVYNHTHVTVADVIAHEVSSESYVRVNVTNRTARADAAGDRALLDAANPLFYALDGVSPAGLIIYLRAGVNDATPSSDKLVCFIQFAETATNGDNFLVELAPDGAMALTTC